MAELVTHQMAAQMLRYDSKTGLLYWLQRPCHNVFAEDIAGTKTSKGYIQIQLNKRLYKAHRIAWLLHFGSWPKGVVDHINGEKTDNRIENLRDVSIAVNSQNQRRPMSTNKSGYLGVSPFKGQWSAEILVSGRKKHIGLFETPDAAHRAYIEEKRKSHHGCTL
ncbi:MAG: hypothetical protein RL758_22 [Pseudomonadota bacterium]|jgi:hypothetical protein